MKILKYLFILLGSPAMAAVQSWDISNPNDFVVQTQQLVVNQSLRVLHPSLYVKDFKAGFTPYFIEVGKGEHGPFDMTTYANFSKNGDISGNKIRIDTDTFPVLNFTNFYLEEGWIIDVVGGQPLVINSLTSITIAGEIWCHGENGGDASLAQAGLGGRGRCGGSDGGDGGDISNNASDARDRDQVGGGKGGSNTGAEMNGGGGGSWNDSSPATAGGSANNGFGEAGATLADPEFSQLFGSAGGGGGGTGIGNEPGAGGGGGGGLVVLHAVQDIIFGKAPTSIFGLVRINGGNGGDSLTTTGGAGGGGGAGSLQVFAGRNIELYNTAGAGVVISQSGLGGNNGTESGGNGGKARNWFSSFGYNTEGTGFYNPAEQAPLTPGVVEFSTDSQSAESISFDTKNTLTEFRNVMIAPETSAVTWKLAGSNDNFKTDDTGWTSNINELTGKRYVKIKVTLSATDVNNPETIESVQLLYQPGSRSDFEFEAAGCGRVSDPSGPTSFNILLMLLPFLTLLFIHRNKSI